MSAFKFQYYEDRAHALVRSIAIARVQRRSGETEVEARMATYSLFVCAATDHERQAAHGRYKFRSAVVEVASGKNHA